MTVETIISQFKSVKPNPILHFSFLLWLLIFLLFISIAIFILVVLQFVVSLFAVLMKLVTRLTTLDESRSKKIRYLAEWFWRIKINKEKLMFAIDPVLEPNEETY
jgi:hypothetical protein